MVVDVVANFGYFTRQVLGQAPGASHPGVLRRMGGPSAILQLSMHD